MNTGPKPAISSPKALARAVAGGPGMIRGEVGFLPVWGLGTETLQNLARIPMF